MEIKIKPVIIDIKPYTPQYDEVKGAKTPEWINKLEY